MAIDTELVHKILVTALVLAVLGFGSAGIRRALGRLGERAPRIRFWGQQTSSLVALTASALFLTWFWLRDTSGAGTAVGLVSAGLAVALQKAVTSFAAYLVILRGKAFTVGDHIVVGQVRGKVVALGFFQITVLELGESPAEQDSGPAMWVRGRQFSGRVITVSNSVIFDSAVYNYTHDFPYVWSELTLPVAYRDDRAAAEKALLQAARAHAVLASNLDAGEAQRLEREYALRPEHFEPRVYWRITDNWLEMTLRFVTPEVGSRDVSNAVTRDLLASLDAAGVGIASATSEIVGMPPLRATVEWTGPALSPASRPAAPA